MSGKNTLNDDWVTSVARAFRLATIQNLYDNRLVTKEEAEDLLRGPLVPVERPSHPYDIFYTHRGSTCIWSRDDDE